MSTTPAPQPEKPRPKGVDSMPRAMAFMIFSGLSFALMGAAVKFSGELPLSTKVFFRNLVTLGITSFVAVRMRENPFRRTPHLAGLLVRSICGLVGVYLYFLALGRMNLADASLLNKTSPFFVAGFAVLILKERLNRTVITALLVAFIGAILVIKPRFDVSALPALAGLGSGMCAGMAYTMVRLLKGRVSPNRIIFTFSLISTAVTLPFLILTPPHADTGQWLALILTGVFAAGGQYGLTFAYHHAPASRISIFTYLHVLFALLAGFALFGERPDVASVLGGAMIVFAAWRMHRGEASRRAPRRRRRG
jgi:drug/metabolite transporter (DMT)-like permease